MENVAYVTNKTCEEETIFLDSKLFDLGLISYCYWNDLLFYEDCFAC